MQVFVSLISDQPLANILFIKQFVQQGDIHVFVTTLEMEKADKAKIIASTLKIGASEYSIVLVDPNDAGSIILSLDAFEWPMGDKYMVNITGGTKMMSQMVYTFFSERASLYLDTEIYYWPATNLHLQQLIPAMELRVVEHPVQLDLDTYFAAHGFSIKYENKLTFPLSHAAKLFNKCLHSGTSANVSEISIAKQDYYSGEHKGYYTGGWFEEYLYEKLKQKYKLDDKHIGFGLKMKYLKSERTNESDYEIDVAYILNNRLFLWEAKVFNSKLKALEELPEVIYKLASINRSIGLNTKAYLAILTKMYDKHNMRKKFYTDLSNLFRLGGIFTMEDFIDNQVFEHI